jgi:hypothetical protein
MLFPIIKRNWLTNIFASLFIFLFVYTATNKLLDIDKFRTIISQSPIIHAGANIISWAVPIIELGISILLFIRWSREYGFLASVIIMAVFTLYVAYMILFSPHLPCSCGGVIAKMSWTQHLLFNSVFLFLAFLGWRITKSMNKDFIAIDRISRTPV